MAKPRVTRPQLLAAMNASGWAVEWRWGAYICVEPETGWDMQVFDTGGKLHIFAMHPLARLTYEEAFGRLGGVL
jgi:hypothetical protein